VIACEIDLGEDTVEHVERGVVWSVRGAILKNEIEEALLAIGQIECAHVDIADALPPCRRACWQEGAMATEVAVEDVGACEVEADALADTWG
jgi:hypothetical protein